MWPSTTTLSLLVSVNLSQRKALANFPPWDLWGDLCYAITLPWLYHISGEIIFEPLCSFSVVSPVRSVFGTVVRLLCIHTVKPVFNTVNVMKTVFYNADNQVPDNLTNMLIMHQKTKLFDGFKQIFQLLYLYHWRGKTFPVCPELKKWP